MPANVYFHFVIDSFDELGSGEGGSENELVSVACDSFECA